MTIGNKDPTSSIIGDTEEENHNKGAEQILKSLFQKVSKKKKKLIETTLKEHMEHLKISTQND